MDFTVSKYSHYFIIHPNTSDGKVVCTALAKRFTQYGMIREGRRQRYGPIKVFAAANKERTWYRFHINAWSELINTLYSYPHVKYEIKQMPVHTGRKEKFKLGINSRDNTQYKAKEKQVPLIEYCSTDKPIKLIQAQTGFGKSVVLSATLVELQTRAAIIIKPMYIDKWVADLQEYLGLDVKDIMVVEGAPHLKKLFRKAKERMLKSKVIIISNRTLQSYISTYEEIGEKAMRAQGWLCMPDNMYEFLDIGVKAVDEVHQEFHFNFKQDLYTNVPTTISLSATLIHNDSFIVQMYKVMFPLEIRAKEIPLIKHAHATAVFYNLQYPNLAKTTNPGDNKYSHTAFEDYIISRPALLNKYLDMIYSTFSISYDKSPLDGKRGIIFAATIKMCTFIRDYMRVKYPKLDVERYTAIDPYENATEPDIIVSTLGSAGTAIDIKLLVTAFLTTAVDSIQANVQSFGRLREIPNEFTEFLYLVCLDLEKPLLYHQNKLEYLQNRAKSIKSVNSGWII